MSISLQEQIISEYAIDDPDTPFGEVEAYISPPFEAGHLIHIVRQLQKHGYNVQQSSGSFQHGCVMTIPMGQPANIKDILANAPGVRDVWISDDLEEISERINRRPSPQLVSDKLGVPRIMVTTEPTKEDINIRLESFNGPPAQNQGAGWGNPRGRTPSGSATFF